MTPWTERNFNAGVLLNEPDSLLRWITDPPEVELGTAMPDVSLDDATDRDVRVYLYTLKE